MVVAGTVGLDANAINGKYFGTDPIFVFGYFSASK